MLDINLVDEKRTLSDITHDNIMLLYKLERRVKTMTHQGAYKQLAEYFSQFVSEAFKSNVILYKRK